MKLSQFKPSCSADVIALYTEVFSSSESEEEGKIIGNLVSKLIKKTEQHDLVGFVASSNDRIVGCIFFSRLVVPNNSTAFMLSPVAIASEEQGKGIGQQLINHGLGYLKSIDINLVFTYGDPNYYSKVGFKPISESIVSAPFKLSQPEGWLAQSLDGSTINSAQGSSQCVEAFNNQAYW
jgi:putative acetyltransferase